MSGAPSGYSEIDENGGELPPILVSEDIARHLRITVVHARRLLASKEIPNRKRGKRRYVLREEFLRWLRPNKRGRRTSP